jgi:hypothetical protein
VQLLSQLLFIFFFLCLLCEVERPSASQSRRSSKSRWSIPARADGWSTKKPMVDPTTTTLSVFKLLLMIFWFMFHHSNYSFFKISYIFVIIYFIIFWFMSLSASRVEVLTRVVGATNHQPEIWSINTQMCCHNNFEFQGDYRRATLLLLLWLATACNKTHRQRVPDRQRWWPYQNYEWSWMSYTIIPCNSTIAHHSLYQNNVTTL